MRKDCRLVKDAHMVRLLSLIFALCLVAALPAAAQDNVDPIAPQPLTLGVPVGGSITNENYFELWQVSLGQGQVINVQMAADGGLLPLVGVLSAGGDLVARSEDGNINATVSLQYAAEAEGIYTIVATRAERENGTTSGTYSLLVELVVGAPSSEINYQEVTFRCDALNITSALTFELPSGLVSEESAYKLVVIGLDGFVPVVRVRSEENDPNLCRQADGGVDGMILSLPDADPIIMDETQVANTFLLNIGTPALLGDITITIGSLDGAGGRYIAFLTGMNIEAAGETDEIAVWVGPRAAAETEAFVYAIAADDLNSRLDPYLTFLPEGPACDDAGRRGSCDGIPSFNRAGIRIPNELTINGDAFDAGLRLRQADLEAQFIEVGSFSGSTFGAYTLVFMGSLE
jgi:hypothetical protein